MVVSPKVINLLIITGLFFTVFGIVGVNYFKGTFFTCNLQHLDEDWKNTLVENYIKRKWHCLNYGGEWVNKDSNFDNAIVSMITMF